MFIPLTTVGVTRTGVHSEENELSVASNWNPAEGAIQLNSMWVGSTHWILNVGTTTLRTVMVCWQMLLLPQSSRACHVRVAAYVACVVKLVVVLTTWTVAEPHVSLATGWSKFQVSPKFTV